MNSYDRFKAVLIAVAGNYPVHVDCGSEVRPKEGISEGMAYVCHGCEKQHVSLSRVVRPEDVSKKQLAMQARNFMDDVDRRVRMEEVEIAALKGQRNEILEAGRTLVRGIRQAENLEDLGELADTFANLYGDGHEHEWVLKDVECSYDHEPQSVVLECSCGEERVVDIC